MSSSSRLKTSDDISHKFIEFKLCCESYQHQLIKHMKASRDVPKLPVVTLILDALDHERTVAGNLAGLMDIQMNGYASIADKAQRIPKWSLGETDFVNKLDASIKEKITNELNALHKQNFSEDDLVMIMQKILISQLADKNSLFVNQYEILMAIKQLVVESIGNDDINARNNLLEIQKLIKDNNAVLENLSITPAHISLFSKRRTFVSDANELLGETSELGIRHKAS